MKAIILLTLTTLIFVASISFAAYPNLTKEERTKMAQIHAQMAVCLKTEANVETCQQEMMKACRNEMGKTGCMMMGMGRMKGMKMGQGMMMYEDEESKDKKSDTETEKK